MGLCLRYHLQLEVNRKPLLVWYKLHANVKDDDGINQEFKISEVCCMHNANISRKIP